LQRGENDMLLHDFRFTAAFPFSDSSIHVGA